MSGTPKTDPSEADTVQAIRQRLAAIGAELGALAPTDFPAKHVLNTEADELRAILTADDSDAELVERWAARAGRKGIHAHDPAAAAAGIVSPGENGGSVG